jgi:purine-binding chemotaxis protein CheW
MSGTSSALSTTPSSMSPVLNSNGQKFVSLYLGNQMFGIPVEAVQDVLKEQEIEDVPLSKGEIAGVLNLRGRVVTAIDMRHRLNLIGNTEPSINVVIEYGGELYSLLVDSVGDVISPPGNLYEKNPANLEASFRNVSIGVYRLEQNLMLILDIDKIFSFQSL